LALWTLFCPFLPPVQSLIFLLLSPTFPTPVSHPTLLSEPHQEAEVGPLWHELCINKLITRSLAALSPSRHILGLSATSVLDL
jgi:hypothetical protein